MPRRQNKFLSKSAWRKLHFLCLSSINILVRIQALVGYHAYKKELIKRWKCCRPAPEQAANPMPPDDSRGSDRVDRVSDRGRRDDRASVRGRRAERDCERGRRSERGKRAERRRGTEIGSERGRGVDRGEAGAVGRAASPSPADDSRDIRALSRRLTALAW